MQGRWLHNKICRKQRSTQPDCSVWRRWSKQKRPKRRSRYARTDYRGESVPFASARAPGVRSGGGHCQRSAGRSAHSQGWRSCLSPIVLLDSACGGGKPQQVCRRFLREYAAKFGRLWPLAKRRHALSMLAVRYSIGAPRCVKMLIRVEAVE